MWEEWGFPEQKQRTAWNCCKEGGVFVSTRGASESRKFNSLSYASREKKGSHGATEKGRKTPMLRSKGGASCTRAERKTPRSRGRGPGFISVDLQRGESVLRELVEKTFAWRKEISIVQEGTPPLFGWGRTGGLVIQREGVCKEAACTSRSTGGGLSLAE